MTYYIPKIEDFYEGYEYEELVEGYEYTVKLLEQKDGVQQLEILSSPESVQNWEKRVYKTDSFVDLQDGEIVVVMPKVRVAKVSPRDFSDLGWTLKDIKESPYTSRPIYTYTKEDVIGFNTGVLYTLTTSDTSRVELSIDTYGSYSNSHESMFFNIYTKNDLTTLIKLVCGKQPTAYVESTTVKDQQGSTTGEKKSS